MGGLDRKAVELLEAIKQVRKRGEIPPEWLSWQTS